MNDLKITKCEINFIDGEGKIKGIVKIILNNCITLNDIKIVDGFGDLFISYPTYKVGMSSDLIPFFSIDSDLLKNQIERTIFKQYSSYLFGKLAQ